MPNDIPSKELLSRALDVLNAQIEAYETRLGKFKPIPSEGVTIAVENKHTETDILLGYCKHNGRWRLVCSDDEAKEMRPLVECVASLRVKMVSEFPTLTNQIVVSKASFFDSILEATKVAQQACRDLDSVGRGL